MSAHVASMCIAPKSCSTWHRGGISSPSKAPGAEVGKCSAEGLAAGVLLSEVEVAEELPVLLLVLLLPGDSRIAAERSSPPKSEEDAMATA